MCAQKHTCTLCCLAWANKGKQAEARPKTYSKSRNCTFKKVAGSPRDILLTKILEKGVSDSRGGAASSRKQL